MCTGLQVPAASCHSTHSPTAAALLRLPESPGLVGCWHVTVLALATLGAKPSPAAAASSASTGLAPLSGGTAAAAVAAAVAASRFRFRCSLPCFLLGPSSPLAARSCVTLWSSVLQAAEGSSSVMCAQPPNFLSPTRRILPDTAASPRRRCNTVSMQGGAMSTPKTLNPAPSPTLLLCRPYFLRSLSRSASKRRMSASVWMMRRSTAS